MKYNKLSKFNVINAPLLHLKVGYVFNQTKIFLMITLLVQGGIVMFRKTRRSKRSYTIVHVLGRNSNTSFC